MRPPRKWPWQEGGASQQRHLRRKVGTQAATLRAQEDVQRVMHGETGSKDGVSGVGGERGAPKQTRCSSAVAQSLGSRHASSVPINGH